MFARLLLDVLDTVLRPWARLGVVSLVYGRKLSYARVEGGWCGVAYAPSGLEPQSLDYSFPAAPRLIARRADSSPADRSLAVAVINALSSAYSEYTPGTVMPLGRGEPPVPGPLSRRRVVLLGYMSALARQLASRGALLAIAEEDEELAAKARSEGFRVVEGEALIEEIEEADYVLMSGSAVVLWPERARRELGAARRAAARVLVGPTSSFHPALAHKLGATHVAGTLIPRTLCGEAEQLVALGAGYHLLRRRLGLVKFLSPPPPGSPPIGFRLPWW